MVLHGRVRVSEENGAICSLTAIADPSEWSAASSRRRVIATLDDSLGGTSTPVWIDGDGMLRATAADKVYDLSGLVFLRA